MENCKQLSQLLDHLKIENWDILLIGDGSGASWGPCGWGCLSIERKDFSRTMWYGSMNHGTVNVAEYMAYIQPLIYYASRKYDNFQHVHIITDSQVVAAASTTYICGKFLSDFLAKGFIVKTHWLERSTLEANKLADMVSKYARADIKDAKYDQTAITLLGKQTAYEIEPTT